MNLTLEVEYGVIREAVWHRLNTTLFNQPNKVWRESTQTRTPTLPFHISDYLGYTNGGHNGIVELMDTNTNDADGTKYRILLSTENTMLVTTDLLKSRSVPYLALIAIYSEYYIKKSKNFTQEETNSIIFLEVLSPLQ